jgi:hypothetical protein
VVSQEQDQKIAAFGSSYTEYVLHKKTAREGRFLFFAKA